MRAWTVTAPGDPADVLRLNPEASVPNPGKRQVRVAVEAAGLGLPDVLMCQGGYPLTPSLPFVPSQEAAGRVVEIGEGVDPSLLNSRVLGPSLFQQGHGALADFCLMHAGSIFPLPEDMTGAEAAGFFIPFQTAWIGLVQRAGLSAGDTVLVLGASGSAGSAALQLAKARGARVIAVAGGPEKSAFCTHLGADKIIDHRVQDIFETTLQLTDGRGASLVFDTVGGAAAGAALKATAGEGRFVAIGYASGSWVQVDTWDIVSRNISVIGAIPMGFGSRVLHAAHDDLMGLWGKGQIRFHGKVFEFTKAPDAINHIAHGKTQGKIVVRVN